MDSTGASIALPGATEVCSRRPAKRTRPFTDEEIAEIVQLCDQAIEGPFMIGDLVDGEGKLLATLADGRPLVVRGLGPGDKLEPHAVEATLKLLCRSRQLLLHLIDERSDLRQERDELQAKLDAVGAVTAADVTPAEEGTSKPRPR